MTQPPAGYRPMQELTRRGLMVEMVLEGTGEIVFGWLGGEYRGERTFWANAGQQIRPLGWRELGAQRAREVAA